MGVLDEEGGDEEKDLHGFVGVLHRFGASGADQGGIMGMKYRLECNGVWILLTSGFRKSLGLKVMVDGGGRKSNDAQGMYVAELLPTCFCCFYMWL